MPVLILQFLPYLFQAAQTIPELWQFVQKVRSDLQQSGEWSAEAEAAFNKELQDLKDNPPDWWKTDDQT